MGLADRDYGKAEWEEKRRPMGFAPSPVLWLAILHFVGFVYSFANSGSTRSGVGFWMRLDFPQAVTSGQVWRLITYPLYNNNPFGAILSVVMLYFVGRLLEFEWSGRKLWTCYGLIVLAGALGAGFMALLRVDVLPVFGAMFPVMGLMTVAATKYPNLPVSPLFLPIQFRLRSVALFFIGLSVLMILLLGRAPGLEFGLLAGCVAAGYWIGTRPQSRSELAEMYGARRETEFDAEPREGFLQKMARKWREDAKRREREADRALDAEVDRVLEKVRQEGLHSLTSAEKKTLHRATERENERSKRR